MEPSVAVAVIAGNEVDRSSWERLIASLKGRVDGIFISWNGSPDGPPRWMLSCGLPHVAWCYTPWNDDFAEQRNASFALVDRDAYDWILWIDTDDELVAPEGFGPLVASLDEYTLGVFLYYSYGSEGDVDIVSQWRERLMSTKGTWVWTFPVHETCQGGPGTQYAKRDGVWIRHHKRASSDETRVRNRRILAKARNEIDHPRITYQLANEVYAEAETKIAKGENPDDELNLAIDLYKRFVSMAPWEDDAYLANHHVADIYRTAGDHAQAIDADLQGVKLRPTWPDSWNGIAESCLTLGDFSRCRDMATICIETCSPPGSTQTLEPLEMTYTPFYLRGCAYEGLGEYKAAIADFERALVAWAPGDLVKRVEGLALAEQSSTNGHGDLKELRKRYRGRHPERSIAFFQRPLFEPWHPELEAKQGAGGAETCVMRLAKLFAADGWRTVVFGTPGPYEGVDSDGIEWWDSSDFLSQEQFTVLVSSRAPQLFDADLRAKVKLLWLHDVNVRQEIGVSEFGDRRNKPDAIITLTPWHKHHTAKLYGLDPDRLIVLPNGIDTSLFPDDPSVRTAPRFVYSSSPDRGVDVVLGLWEEVLDRWPDAQLDVFYGWESIDKIITSKLRGAAALTRFKEFVVELAEGYGKSINWVGRIPQAELAKRLYEQSVWLYPTYFCETFCITALEMQAAGVIPVTSRLAGLEHTVACQEQTLAGWPNNRSFQRGFVDLVDQTMAQLGSDEMRWRQLKGRIHALEHDWESVYESWQSAISDLLEGRAHVSLSVG